MNMSLISQELFDETVLENQDVFELTPEQALEETVSQYSHLTLEHLILSHPNDDSEERTKREEFRNALENLKETVKQREDDATLQSIIEWLETIQACCKANPNAYLLLLHQQEAMDTLLAMFNTSQDNHVILLATIQTLVTILYPNKLQIQSQLRDSMAACMAQWMTYFQSANQHHNVTLQSALLQLAYVSCRSNENNKKQWMKCAIHTALSKKEDHCVRLLLQVLQQPHDDEKDVPLSMIRACQLITTLCRFDDWRAPKHTKAPIVSSAHDHVLEFHRHGAVAILFQVAQECIHNKDDTTNVLAAALSALRVLAIQDDIVQNMVAVGVLGLVRHTLTLEYSEVLAATLGLIRNLSANDEVKTTLCNTAVMSGMLHAMQTFPQHAILQEHACGTMASMALRKPRNSQVIVKEHNGHQQVLQAMQMHPTNTCVQRQGALALRNLASRSKPNDGICEALLDAGAEQVLQKAGRQHQACVDEAYAALRDLGCNVKVMKLDATGKTVERTAMFGENKPNFRPVLEESSNDAKHG